MRLLIAVALVLGACTTYELPKVAPGSDVAPAALPPGTTRTTRDAIAAYRRVADRVEPVAEALCRRENPRAPRNYCDFALIAMTDRSLPPNAFQTIDPSGRPVIAFTTTLLTRMRNDHEIAFILGHEAGHQISNHIAKAAVQSQLAATLAGQLASASGSSSAAATRASRVGAALGARAYSKQFELEADLVGAFVAELSGYDPLIGAQSFARFVGGSRAPFSTHPPSSQRLASVERFAKQLRADKAAGRPLRLPRS